MAKDLLDKWRDEISADISHAFDAQTASRLRHWRLLPFGGRIYLSHRARLREEYIARETNRRLEKKARRL